MKGQTWTTAVLAGLVLVGAARSADGQQVRAEQRRQAFPAEAVDRETRSLALGPDGALALRNVVGDITVRSAPGNEVTLTIVRLARGRTEDDARRGLERVTVSVDERARRAVVESLHAGERNAPYSVTVAYEVAAPAGTSVNIQSLAGNISAAGLAGELSAVTTTGNIDVRNARSLSRARSTTGRVALANVESDGTLEAETVAGDVEINGVRARRLVVGTISGGVIAHDASAERAVLTTTTGGIEYSGTVAPDGRYELRAHTGQVKFIVLGDAGFEVRASTFGGRIVPGPELGLTVIRRDRRELVGTVGDGRAIVTLASFSGGISIERR